MEKLIVVIGAGSIGQAIARRVSAGKHVLLADLRQENADRAAKVLSEAGFGVTTATVDVSSRASVHALVEKATSLGDIHGVIHAAGVSPSQASPETILKVDLYGTALVLEEFGKVIAEGGAGVVIASQSGHRLPSLSAEQDTALATTRSRSCSSCRCFKRIRSKTLSTLISFQSAAIHCGSCSRRFTGASAAHGSTRSAPA
jgi:NAD(P)-dependent dehydrogenase (short-subunit alcohol dehydrogenase family)